MTNIEANVFAIIASKPGEILRKHTTVDNQTCSSFFMLIREFFGYGDHFAPL